MASTARCYTTSDIAAILAANPRWEPLFDEIAADAGIIEEIGVYTGTTIIDMYGCEWLTKEIS